MLSFKDAKDSIIQLAASFGTEAVALQHATGRILAEQVEADRDYPPFNRASMDGYAMKFEDVQDGVLEFKMVEIIFAGQLPGVELENGQCYKIMTGAPVPRSADMIIQREQVTDNNGIVSIPPGNYKQWQQIAKQGEDVRKGETIVTPPVRCSPALISALAASGKATVLVRTLPRISIFTTGDEIVQVGAPVSDFQIRNSNLFMFRSLVQQWGVEPFLCEHVKDDKKELYETLSKGLVGDIVIISGGVSAGDADYVPEVSESLGVKKLFHKVAIKPGKPLWCGHLPGGTMVFALPGNPFSGLVTFTLFVEAYLAHSLGYQGEEGITLPLAGGRTKKSAGDEFFPVKIDAVSKEAIPLSFNGSGDILAAIHADGIAQHPAGMMTLDPQSMIYIRLLKK